MKLNLIEEGTADIIFPEKESQKEVFIDDCHAVFEKNMYEKVQMVSELLDMGMSVEAIERILKIETDVMDNLLK